MDKFDFQTAPYEDLLVFMGANHEPPTGEIPIVAEPLLENRSPIVGELNEPRFKKIFKGIGGRMLRAAQFVTGSSDIEH